MAKKIIKIQDRLVGDGCPVFMIAEVGINHNGDMDIAKRLIDAAFACKWECVKFQKRTPELCVPGHQKDVLRDTPWGRMTYLDYRKKVEFERKEYSYIDKYCREKPIFWAASVWDIPSLDFMLKFDVPFAKIPSAKLTETDLLLKAAESGKPVILSVGMSTINEIDKAVKILDKHAKDNYILMYTNSTYPTPSNELNLLMIKSLKERYDCVVGYSGHEYDLEPTVIAAVLGARIIERHITLDHNMWGSDQFASLEVHAMDMLRKRIQEIDIVMGDGVKKLTPRELEVRKKLRGY
jgi:N-acetylneuraminate synthase